MYVHLHVTCSHAHADDVHVHAHWRGAHLPEGFRLAMKGVSAAMRRKQLSVRSTPAARAMAIRWMVALVEPPVTITRRTAFSKACGKIVGNKNDRR